MKFTYVMKSEYDWNKWFAWYPITYHNYVKGTSTFIWLRSVQRKRRPSYSGVVEYDLRELDGSEIG